MPAQSVYGSKEREAKQVDFQLPADILVNEPQVMNGLLLLNAIPDEVIPVVFFDPQYQGIMEKMSYGNAGVSRAKKRMQLQQMTNETIHRFLKQIHRILIKSGHVFLWIDKYHLCEGIHYWFNLSDFELVDMLVWHKDKMGQGYRSRRTCEYCVVLQKKPKRVKNVWIVRNIPDVYTEKVLNKVHTHQKPLELQTKLISAVSSEGDYVVDPAAGSYSVMKAAHSINRNFIGCDIEEVEHES